VGLRHRLLGPARGKLAGEAEVEDLHDAVVAHHEVRGLDVSMSDAHLPELPYQGKAVVDERLVGLRLADLDRALEELHGDQVLAFRSDLHDAVRLGHRHPRVVEQSKRVVLVLDEAPDGLERGLVLEAAVQDGSPELVPTVGAHVVLRVQLGEQVGVRLALHRETERRGAGRALQTDGLDLEDGQSELL
jgi:hypothetical protein